MAKVEWIQTSDLCIVDRNGKVSIIGIFEKIFSQHVPAVHPIFCVVAKLIGKIGEKIKVHITIEDPQSEIITKTDFTYITFISSNHIVNSQMKFVTFKSFGVYKINLFINDINVFQGEIIFEKIEPSTGG